eukprot:159429_1
MRSISEGSHHHGDDNKRWIVLLLLTDCVFIPVLLVAGLLRNSVFGLSYFVAVITYFAFACRTKTVRFTSLLSSSREQVLCRWVWPWYFVIVFSLTSVIMVLHVTYAIMSATGSISNPDTWKLFGFEPINASNFALVLLPDLIAYVLSPVFMAFHFRYFNVLSRRIERSREEQSPKRASPLYHTLVGLSVFSAGIVSPSLLTIPYFLLFLYFLVRWSLQSRRFWRFGAAMRISGCIYSAVHLIIMVMFQMQYFKDNLSETSGRLIGLEVVDINSFRNSTLRAITFSANALIILFLFVLLCRLERFQTVKTKLQRVDVADVSILSASQPHQYTKFDQSRASATQRRDILWTWFILKTARLVENSGTIFCQAVMLVSCFIYPRPLSLGLLLVVCVSFVVTADVFRRYAFCILLYTVVIICVEYIFVIFHLVPDSGFLSKIVLWNTGIPVFHILIDYIAVIIMAIFSRQYKPWFFRDDAYAGRIVTSARLIRAVRMDNRKLIEKAVESSADLVKETRNEFGQSILHIAAAYGRSQLTQILATPIDIESVDLFRQTPLILAQKFHQEEAFTELRKLYFDVKKLEYKPQQSRWKRGSDALKVTMKVLRSTLYAHAEKLSLVAVYFTGMSSVDYLHMIYLLFFLVFFPWSRLARRFWISLVAYCEIALLLFYAWRVIEPLNINTSDAFKNFSDSTGLSRAEGNLSVALLSAATLVLVVVQLNFFRSQTERRHREYASFERFVRRYGSKEDASIAWPLLYYVTTFFRHFGLILVYLTLILVLGLRSVSVINGGYLVILVVCMLIHQFSSKPETVLKIIWPIVVLYSTFVLFLMYAYQFPTIATWIAGLYPKFLANNVFTLEDIGLVMYNDGQLMWHMLPPTAVCILVVTQYRVFLSRSRQQSVPNSKAARKLLSIQRFCVIFCDKNLHKLFTVIVFILCACQPSMFSFGYLTVLSLFMLAPNGMRHMVKFLSLSASVVALVVFGDQFKKIDEFVGTLISEDYQRFIGFRQHKILLDGIYAELLILIMGAVQHSFARWRRNDLPQQLPSQAGDVLHKEYDVAESPKHEVVRVRSSATGKKSASIELSPASGMDYHAFPDSRGGSSESSSSLSDTQARGTLLSVKSAQVSSSEMDKPPKRTVFMKFIRNLGPRLISLGRNLVNLYGVEMTVIALLIGAFYRETALSLLSIIFVVGGLVFRGPRFLKRFWCSMRTLMALFLIVQYWLADNVFKPPALTTDFGLSIDYRKWLSLSGYESNDLYW